MPIRQLLVTLLLSWFYIGNVNAIPITIDANNYAPGTDISHAIDGVLLQDYSHVAYSDTLTYSAATTPSPLTLCGVNVCSAPNNILAASDFNLTYMLDLTGSDPLSSSGDNVSGLYLSSASGINSFGFTGFNAGAGGYISMFLFNKDGNFIKYESIGNDGMAYYGPEAQDIYYPYSVNYDLSGLSVYSIAVGGGGIDPAFFTSLTVDVPEPASLVLLGVGLFGLGTLRKRKS